jgi:small subunit ribosomal protein S20
MKEVFLATHKSAIKRSKQGEKHRQRNIAIKTSVRTQIKKVLNVADAKDGEGAKAALAATIPAISKAAAKGVFHKKNASRKISRLTKRVNKLVG